MWISAENVGSEPRPFCSTSDDVNEWATTTTPCDILWEIWVLYKKKRFCRNFKNPKKFWKSEKKWKSRFQNFEKIDLIILPNRTNRSNRKKSLNRLDRFIGQRINSHSAMTPFLGGLEAGRKFSFEIKKHENPIIGWNFCQLLAVSAEYLLLSVISKLV